MYYYYFNSTTHYERTIVIHIFDLIIQYINSNERLCGEKDKKRKKYISLLTMLSFDIVFYPDALLEKKNKKR